MKIRISLLLEETDPPQSSLAFTLPDGQQVTLTPEAAQVDLDASSLSDTSVSRKVLTAKTR